MFAYASLFLMNMLNTILWQTCYLILFRERFVPSAKTAFGALVVKDSSVFSANYWFIKSATSLCLNHVAMRLWILPLQRKPMEITLPPLVSTLSHYKHVSLTSVLILIFGLLLLLRKSFRWNEFFHFNTPFHYFLYK